MVLILPVPPTRAAMFMSTFMNVTTREFRLFEGCACHLKVTGVQIILRLRVSLKSDYAKMKWCYLHREQYVIKILETTAPNQMVNQKMSLQRLKYHTVNLNNCLQHLATSFADQRPAVDVAYQKTFVDLQVHGSRYKHRSYYGRRPLPTASGFASGVASGVKKYSMTWRMNRQRQRKKEERINERKEEAALLIEMLVHRA